MNICIECGGLAVRYCLSCNETVCSDCIVRHSKETCPVAPVIKCAKEELRPIIRVITEQIVEEQILPAYIGRWEELTIEDFHFLHSVGISIWEAWDVHDPSVV